MSVKKFLLDIYFFIFAMVVNTTDFLFSLYWDCQKKEIPKLERRHMFLTESAVSLARRIKDKELKSEELVKAVIYRIKQVDPVLNLVCQERYMAAVEEARIVDGMIGLGLTEELKQKPFLGVPFTTKESETVKGWRSTYGLWCRRNTIETEDSDGITKLKNSGAILVCSTNVPEMLLWPESRNWLYGMTLNPHHTGRSAGGSSGGEAALHASLGTPISLCTDAGGSVRGPAFYCGLFGHFLTPNLTNVKGSFEHTGEEEDTILSLGFITKHFEDLIPLFKVLLVDKPGALDLDRRVDVKKLRIFYVMHNTSLVTSPIKPSLKKTMLRVVADLKESTGKVPQPYYHKDFDNIFSTWVYKFQKEPNDLNKLYHNNQKKPNFVVELFKKIFCMSTHCWSSIFLLVLKTFIFPFLDPKLAQQRIEGLRKDLLDLLGDDGVLLFPSFPAPAPYHYLALFRGFDVTYMAIFNAIQFPATQVPVGRDSHTGMPLGLQVAAAPYQDVLPLAVAEHLQRTLAGAVLPPNITEVAPGWVDPPGDISEIA